MFIINEYGYLKRLRLLFYPPRSSPLCVHEDVGQYTIESRPGQTITLDGQARYQSVAIKGYASTPHCVCRTAKPTIGTNLPILGARRQAARAYKRLRETPSHRDPPVNSDTRDTTSYQYIR